MLRIQVRYPSHFYLLRGRHETLSMINQYLFRSPMDHVWTIHVVWLTLSQCPIRYSLSYECEKTYGSLFPIELLYDVFCSLPLAAVVNRKVIHHPLTHDTVRLFLYVNYTTQVFCVSGGLSPQLESLAQMESLDR